MKIKNVVFDIGGVILKFLPYRIIKDYSVDKNEEELLKNLFLSPLWGELDAGTKSFREVAEIYHKESGIAEERVMGLFQTIYDGLKLIPETEAFIKRLLGNKNVNVYYLSNMPEKFMKDLMEEYPIFNRMDGGVYSADIKAIKPDYKIYRELEKRYDIKKDETIFFDDMEANVQAAIAFGWNARVYNQHNAKDVIDDIIPYISVI